MQFDRLTAIWAAYRGRLVDMTISPNDHMFSGNQGSMAAYNFVGESAAKSIFTVLSQAPTEAVWRILDFGCGAGRVARHLSAMFPNTEMFFCDIDKSRADFCARQFGGTAIISSDDFSKVDLPGDLDLIWVGSLFTHIDYERMQFLFDKLWQSLRRQGVIIATFHGRRAKEIGKMIAADKWEKILADYNSTGVGYESYGREDLGDVGVSLTSPAKVIDLGGRHENAHLIMFVETGWAGIQDVAAWSKA